MKQQLIDKLEQIAYVLAGDEETPVIDVKDARTLITKLSEIIERQQRALERLTKVGPPSRATTGIEYAQVALTDNCGIARTCIEETKAMIEELKK